MRPDDRGSGGWLATLATAFAGVLLGHWAGYRLIFPNPAIRDVVLRGTGHAYWASAVRLAITLAVVALTGAAIRGVAARGLRSGRNTPSPLEVFAHLAVIQMAGFTAMEVAERLLAGAPLATLVHHDLFPVGLLLQVAVALLGASALLGVSRLARRAVEVLAVVVSRPRWGRAGSRWFDVPTVALALAPLGGTGRRGPPGV